MEMRGQPSRPARSGLLSLANLHGCREVNRTDTTDMTNLESATYDLLGMILDHPVTAEFEGEEYEGTAGGIITSQELEPGGFVEDFDYSWVTSLKKRVSRHVDELEDRFPDEPPAVGDDLTIDGVEYRIVRTTMDDYGAGVQFDLRTVNK